MIGNEFSPAAQKTKNPAAQAAEIASWSECANVPCKQLFQLFASSTDTKIPYKLCPEMTSTKDVDTKHSSGVLRGAAPFTYLC